MKIGIIKNCPPKGNDWELIRDAAQKHGHSIEKICLNQIWLETKNNQVIWQDKLGFLDRFDVILVRGGGILPRIQYSFLSWFKQKGGLAVDDKFASRPNLADKVQVLNLLKEADFLVPDYYLFTNKDIALKLAKNLQYPLMLKNKRKHRGQGVIFIESFDEFKQKLNEIEDISDWFLQELISWEKDLRVFVVGDKVLGAIERIAAEGEHRANISLGGEAKKYDLPENLAKIALKATKLMGVEIGGVDFLLTKDNAYIIELNTVPQFYGFIKATDINVPEEIILYLEQLIKENDK